MGFAPEPDSRGLVPAMQNGCQRDTKLGSPDADMASLGRGGPAQPSGRARRSDDPHRSYAGGRPSTLILLDALTPEALGGLIAMYEHSVYAQSVLWGINAFDQFGVELGKQVASRLLPALRGDADADDPVTRALLDEIRRRA